MVRSFKVNVLLNIFCYNNASPQTWLHAPRSLFLVFTLKMPSHSNSSEDCNSCWLATSVTKLAT